MDERRDDASEELAARNAALAAWAETKAAAVRVARIADFAEEPLLLLDGPGAAAGAGPFVKLSALGIERGVAALILRDALVTRIEGRAREIQSEIVARWQVTEAAFAQAEKDYEAAAAEIEARRRAAETWRVLAETRARETQA